LKLIPKDVLGIQVCKIGAFPEGWLEKNIYRKNPNEWKRKK